MSELNALAERLGNNLKKRMEPESPETKVSVVGVLDFGGLVDALFGVMLDFLDDCLSNFNVDDVTGEITNLGPLQRWALRRQINRSEIPKSQQLVARQAAVETLEESTPEQIKAGVTEFRQKTRDWGF